MVNEIGNDLLSNIIYVVMVETDPHGIHCLAQVSKLFSLSCHNPLLWQKLLQRDWRWQLLPQHSFAVDWRRAYIDLELTTATNIADWQHQFSAHETEPEKWKQPIEAFLKALVPENDAEATTLAFGRQSAQNQLRGESLLNTKRSAVTAAAAAQFLWEAEMDRAMRGEFLGSCTGMGLPMAFVSMLPLEGVDVVGGIRMLLEKLCTRTSYALNRIMRALGAQLFEVNSELVSGEAAHSLIYAAMMLNTDMYSKNVKAHHRMSKELFVEKVLEMVSEHPVQPAVIEQIFDSIAKGGPLRVGGDEQKRDQDIDEPSAPPIGTQFHALTEGCCIC